MADDTPGPFLRLHLVDGDTIDLDTEGQALDADTIGDLLADSDAISGIHAGGNRCAVPVASILWAEAIE